MNGPTIAIEAAPAETPRTIDRLLTGTVIGPREVLAALAILVAIAFVRAPLRQVPGALFVSDGFGYYVYLPSLVLDHDLDLSNQLPRVPYEGNKDYFNRVEKSGIPANPFPIGPALLWLPFFLLGHVAAIAVRAAGANPGVPGFGYVYELPTYCGAFLYGVAGLWLISRLISEVFSVRMGRLVTFAILFCTPYAYYLWIEPDMSHVISGFAIALFLYATWRAMRRDDLRLRTWIGIGAAAGLVALVRPYNGLVAVAVLPAAWYVARHEQRLVSATIRSVVVAGLTAAIVFLPQVIVASVLYGQLMFLPPNTGYDAMMWTRPDVPALLVSVFSFFPLLIAAFAGLVLPAKARMAAHGPERREWRDAARAFVGDVRPLVFAGMLVVMYIIAAYPRGSTFGDSFGQRRIPDWAGVLAIGYAVAFAAMPESWQRRLPALVVTLGIVEVVIAIAYTLKLLPQWGGTAFLR